MKFLSYSGWISLGLLILYLGSASAEDGQEANRDTRAAKRKCKTKKKCSKEGAFCLNYKQDCYGPSVDSLCKGASCKCCLTGWNKCKSKPTCAFRGGVCVRRKKASKLCEGGTIDDNGCRGRKCSCCVAKEQPCMCGMINPKPTTAASNTTTTTSTLAPNTTTTANSTTEEPEDDSPWWKPWKIGGGRPLDPVDKMPWVVGVQLDSFDGGYDCAAAIVNTDFVVTTASCVGTRKKNKVRVSIADSNPLSTDDDIKGVSKVMKVKKIYVHKDYSDSTQENNIALLMMKKPLDLISSDMVKPVCLPTVNEDFAGMEGFVAGWGSASSNSTLQDTPKEANVTILALDCDKKTTVGGATVSDKTLCASGPEGGSCSSDSGAPLTVMKDGRHVLAGLASGLTCTPDTEIYTRMTAYTQWMIDTMAGEGFFCRYNRN